MTAQKQQKVLKAMIKAHPLITVGEAAKRLNNIKKIYKEYKDGHR